MSSLDGVNIIAIVDDDDLQAQTIGDLVLDAGFEVAIVPGPFDDVTTLVDRIHMEAQAAICDHRLSHGSYAHFPGAEAAANLYHRGIPALLVTQYLEMDADVTIRRWRPWIPVVLSRNEVAENPDRILQGLALCQQELKGIRSSDRRTQRSLIRIADMGVEGGEKVLDVFVSTWQPLTAVRIPLGAIPESLRAYAKIGAYYVARVNTEAERSEDLFFDDFALAPEPIELG